MEWGALAGGMYALLQDPSLISNSYYQYVLAISVTCHQYKVWIATALTHTEQHPAGAVAAFFLWLG